LVDDSDVVLVYEWREGSSKNVADGKAEMPFPGGGYKQEFAILVERENDIE
jgi:hypothetical protein